MNVEELWKEVEEALTTAGDSVALIELNGDLCNHWTGIQLLALTHQLRQILAPIDHIHENDASQTQLVGIYLENSAIYVGAVLAAISCNLSFLPLDPRWPSQRLLQILENCKPACIFYAEKDGGVVGACGAPPLANIPSKAETDTHLGCRLIPITPALVASARSITTAAALETLLLNLTAGSKSSTGTASTIAYVMTTSGSTGGSTNDKNKTIKGPLGVCGTALGIFQRCKWMEDTYPFHKGDIVAFKTNPCFVDSIWEIFGPLLSGGTAAILAVPFSVSVNPYSLVENCLIKYGVTHMTAVPTTWQQIVDASRCSSSSSEEKEIKQRWREQLKLRQVVSSGEQLPWQLLHDMHEMILPKGCQILNLYGTTEVAADATVLDCTNLLLKNENNNGAAAVPVGFPLQGVVIVLAKIIDVEQQEEENNSGKEGVELVKVCSGARGQVLIGGWGVAAGYCSYRGSSYTSSKIINSGGGGNKFIKLNMQQITPSYMLGNGTSSIASKEESSDGTGKCSIFFRSGDVGSIDAQGRLCIIGRKDLQVKINGVRVDLVEVEEVIRSHHAVRAVAVKMWSVSPAEEEKDEKEIEKRKILGIYVELENKDSVDTIDSWADLQIELKSLCALKLGIGSSIAFYFEKMVNLPRSSGGKVDRSALLQPPQLLLDAPQARLKRMKYSEKDTTTTIKKLSEIQVYQAFAAALGHGDFEPTSNLFTVLGGSSITAVSIAEKLGIEVENVYRNPTVRSLAHQQQQEQQQQEVEDGEGGLAQKLIVSVDIPELQVLWRSKMKDCVDAPPLFHSTNRVNLTLERHRAAVIFAASHGGDVSCFDASSGANLWNINIPNEQPDPGMALIDSFQKPSSKPPSAATATPAVLAVGLNSGKIKFLKFTTGEELFQSRSIDVGGGGMRAAPAANQNPPVKEGESASHSIWAAGHGHKLIGFNNQAQIVATMPLPAAVSAGIAVRDSFTVFIGCLDGTLMAVAIDKKEKVDFSGGQLELSICWKVDCGSPIFATPTIIINNSNNNKNAAEIVVVATASGLVVAVDTATGKVLWRRVIDPGGVYIPALYVSKWNMIVVGSRSGQFVWIDVADGFLVKARYQVESPSVAGVVAVTAMLMLPKKDKVESDNSIDIVVSTDNGQILVLNSSRVGRVVGQSGDDGAVTVNISGRYQLPAPSFSGFSYGNIGDNEATVIYVGCRDDYLYCLIN